MENPLNVTMDYSLLLFLWILMTLNFSVLGLWLYTLNKVTKYLLLEVNIFWWGYVLARAENLGN